MTSAPSPDRASQPPIALTMGEPAGVGGEITLKAWRFRNRETPVFFLIDDPARIRSLGRDLGMDIPVIGWFVPTPFDMMSYPGVIREQLFNPLLLRGWSTDRKIGLGMFNRLSRFLRFQRVNVFR